MSRNHYSDKVWPKRVEAEKEIFKVRFFNISYMLNTDAGHLDPIIADFLPPVLDKINK
nr:hypothetical protein [Candidatus Sigynarchaeota archaeon]